MRARRVPLVMVAITILVAAAPAHAGNGFVAIDGINPCPVNAGLGDAQAAAVSPDGLHVYVLGNALTIWERSAGNGALTQVGVVSGITGLDLGTRLAISPDGAYVYASGDDRILVFSRDAGSGGLALVQTVQDGVGGVSGIATVHDMAMSPDGKHVYVAGSTGVPAGGTVVVFARDGATGLLATVEVHENGVGPITGLGRSANVAVAPDGAHVYVGGAVADGPVVGGQATLHRFTRDAATGALTHDERIDPAGSLVQQVVASPDGEFLYVETVTVTVATPFPLTLHVYARDAATGALTLASSGDSVGSGLTFTPDGTRAYSHTGFDPSVVFEMERDPVAGTLTSLGSFHFTFDFSHYVRALAIDPAGTTLYIVPEGTVTTAGIVGPSQRLAHVQTVSGSRVIISLTVTPDGAHVYAGCFDQEALVGLARDPANGSLAPVHTLRHAFDGVVGLRRPGAGLWSPDGAHLYLFAVADDFDTVLTVLARDAATGALSHVQTLPLTGSVQGCRGAAIDPAGTAVYVGCGSTLSVFARDAVSGALGLLEEHEHGVGGVSGLDRIRGVAVSGDGAHVYVGDHEGTTTVFVRNPATGALMFAGAQSWFTPDPDFSIEFLRRIISDATGERLYVDAIDGIRTYVRDATSGLLSLVDVRRQDADGNDYRAVNAFAVSSAGTQLFVADSFHSSLAVFRRDPETGRLGFADRVPLGGAADVVAAPGGEHVYVATGADVTLLRASKPCSAAPLAGCRHVLAAHTSVLQFNDNLLDTRNTLGWKHTKGDATALEALGDPLSTTGYALCLYDASAVLQPVMAAEVRPGGTCGKKPCWSARSSGFKYSANSIARGPDGMSKVLLKAGGTGKAKVVLKATGGGVPLPRLPLTLPVTAQLQSSTGECWEATYSTALRNEDRFKAVSD